MNLFKLVNFTSAAGLQLDYKIECDALKEDDWRWAAKQIAKYATPFKEVIPVPRGGYLLAKHLEEYIDSSATKTLVVDDVYTTGKSISKYMAGDDYEGWVVFARAPIVSANVNALWQFTRHD